VEEKETPMIAAATGRLIWNISGHLGINSLYYWALKF